MKMALTGLLGPSPFLLFYRCQPCKSLEPDYYDEAAVVFAERNPALVRVSSANRPVINNGQYTLP